MDISKETTIKNFIKANTDLRMATEAAPTMLNGLNQLGMELVKQAETVAKSEDRTTILDRDIEAAFKSLSGVQSTPEGLFKVVEKMKPEEVGKLSILIANWVKERRKQLGIG